jgi:hypothetical protein
VDILIDQQLEPFLLEVNHTPSFTADTPLDLAIKRSLVYDALRLVNTNPDLKRVYFEEKPENRRRMRFAPHPEGEPGGFIRIQPSLDATHSRFVKLAYETWERSSGLKRPIS